MINSNIKNGYYYKIVGTITADNGEVITNPVIKMGIEGNSLATAVNTGIYNCEYEVFFSEANYLAGYYFCKAWDTVEGKRIKNFTAPYDAELSGANAAEKQRQMIADQFGWSVDDVVLVIEEAE